MKYSVPLFLPPGGLPTPQEVIDAAKSGSYIVMPSGTFTLQRPLNVSGLRHVVIDGTGCTLSPTFQCGLFDWVSGADTCTDVLMKNFTISGKNL